MTQPPEAPAASVRPDGRIDPSQCHVRLILNAKSGKKDAGAKLGQIRERLERACLSLTVIETRHGAEIGPAAQEAKAAGADIVAAFGGDGTQSAVAGALAGTRTVMAVLPGGTFNYFARELGVGDSLETALAAFESGYLGHRDLGTLNGRVFLNNASFGLYPAILEHREALYKRWGRSRAGAYWSVLTALANLRDPLHFTLEANGVERQIDTPLAFIARSAFQLESLGLEGAQAVREGHFALFLAKSQSRLGLARAALKLALGRVSKGDDFEMIVSDSLTIEPQKRSKTVALDGEKARMIAPFKLDIMPKALRVCLPAPPESAP